MNEPIIFCIDDDPQVLRAISRDLKAKYRGEYKVLSTSSAKEALEALQELKKKGEAVAIFIADQRMPEMDGVSFLVKALEFYPDAKRVLLTAYSDTEAAIKAINEVKLDYYLMKPWDPPEERLFPVVDDLLDEWQNSYQPGFKGMKVIGYQFSPKSHNLKEYLAGNLVPYQWMDIEKNKDAQQLLDLNNFQLKDLPVVLFEDGTALQTPSIQELAARIGLTPGLKNEVYDVVIIGAGPAGLAAAVYGASEGLKTLLIERHSPGGQAGTSSKIENYLGFPAGLSGSELTRRAMAQSTRFGAEFLSPQDVQSIHEKDGYKKLTLEGGAEINARTVVITTGVDYRKLETRGIEEFTGAGVYYGAAMTEAASCKDKEVYVVGGGNSAGQAAMYLSKFARHVYIVIRKQDLTSSMSSYLIDQIKGVTNIQVLGETEIKEALGENRIQQVRLGSIAGGETVLKSADAVYIFIGSRPFTDWIGEEIIRNDKGFIETGRDAKNYDRFNRIWKLQRDPYLLETSAHGIFAAGDVRANAMNRVASAVGEGSMAISFVHKYLAEV
jgi:thioredoxin reductase (NADPH)